jgi:hypothetical protein
VAICPTHISAQCLSFQLNHARCCGLPHRFVCRCPFCTADYLTAYYGDQLPALECVKLKYDPSNLFSMPMDIRPPTGSADHCPALLKKVGTAAADYSRYLMTSGPARSAPPNFDTAPKAAAAPAGNATKAAAAAASSGSKKEAASKAPAGRRLARHLGQMRSAA